MRIPAPPANLWWVLLGMIWVTFLVRLGEWIAAGWPEVML